ncbi:hypothetical protein DPEC_G00114570 [Dallia pectoralis]|uniref:Uncharacterized protein n=1 Tax=Dallia pectoralis TaxID=75939 RepID=A0ACC2GU11_DALPE|nr:hypothetical protein DPEC_G00114570 [Dallia pectoralis]
MPGSTSINQRNPITPQEPETSHLDRARQPTLPGRRQLDPGSFALRTCGSHPKRTGATASKALTASPLRGEPGLIAALRSPQAERAV